MPLVLGLGAGERVDIVAAPGKQPDDTGQHPRLIVDENRQGMSLDLLRCGCSGIMGGGAHRLAYTITLPSSVMASSTLTAESPSSISLWARPEGIMGKQFSAGSTTQSKITALFTSIIALMAASRSPGRSQRMPTA